MALGFLNFLELGARIARPFIQLGVTLGRSLAEIGATLVRAGSTVEAASARRIYEAERVERTATSDIIGRGGGRVPDPSEYSEAVTKQRRQFAWRVRTTYIDPRNGEETTRYLTISTDAMLSPDQAITQAEDMLSEDYAIESTFIVGSDVVSATRAGIGQRL